MLLVCWWNGLLILPPYVYLDLQLIFEGFEWCFSVFYEISHRSNEGAEFLTGVRESVLETDIASAEVRTIHIRIVENITGVIVSVLEAGFRIMIHTRL